MVMNTANVKKEVGVVIVALFLAACSSMPITKDNLQSCRLLKTLDGNEAGQSQIDMPADSAPVYVLDNDEKFYLYTIFTWPEKEKRGGVHLVAYRYYNESGKLVASNQANYDFLHPPVRLSNVADIKLFKEGKHYVDVLVDGNLIERKKFEIKKYKVIVVTIFISYQKKQAHNEFSMPRQHYCGKGGALSSKKDFLSSFAKPQTTETLPSGFERLIFMESANCLIETSEEMQKRLGTKDIAFQFRSGPSASRSHEKAKSIADYKHPNRKLIVDFDKEGYCYDFTVE
jgi:hypothetical protein